MKIWIVDELEKTENFFGKGDGSGNCELFSLHTTPLAK
jgi:hypothetical protein